jgi:hypothetical protein
MDYSGTQLNLTVLLHVHPLLGNGLVNKFPIVGKQSAASLRNNSDNIRSVFNVVCTMPSAKQKNCKHVYNNRCFLWGPCHRFIGENEGRLQSVIGENPRVKDTKPPWKEFVTIQLRSVNGRWRLYVL